MSEKMIKDCHKEGIFDCVCKLKVLLKSVKVISLEYFYPPEFAHYLYFEF